MVDFGSHQGWAQAKTDADDPQLRRPGGAYRQMRERALGSVIALVIIVVALVIVMW